MVNREIEPISEKELAVLSPRSRIVLAARCVLRELPLIGYQGHFDFWGGSATKHVLTLNVAISYVAFVAKDVEMMFVDSALVEGLFAAIDEAIEPINGSVDKAEVEASDVLGDVYRALHLLQFPEQLDELASIARGSSTGDQILIGASRVDFEQFKKDDLFVSLLSPFDHPLWESEQSYSINQPLSVWQHALNSIKFDEIYELYTSFLKGKPAWATAESLIAQWREHNLELSQLNEKIPEPYNKKQNSSPAETVVINKIPSLEIIPPEVVNSNSNEKAYHDNKTYLLTWHPENYPFDKIRSVAMQVEKERFAPLGWSTGNRRHVEVGERVYLMRLGVNPQGVVGSGVIQSEIEVVPHWDKKKAANNKTYNKVSVLWDFLQEKPLLSLETLERQSNNPYFWRRSMGGVEIQVDDLSVLEKEWLKARDELAASARGNIAPRPWLGTDVIPSIGGRYDTSERDSLDVEAQAKIFTSLMIAENVKPPFAIGLLGDWGVGKTFFMRLMQENISAVSGKQAALENRDGSVSRAAQIEFNAWHYVDSDLWASLASHLFDGLSEELREKDEKVEDIRRKLRRTINSSKKEHEQARIAVETAKEKRNEALETLQKLQNDLEEKNREYDTKRLQRIWEAVKNKKDAELKHVSKTCTELGIDGAINCIADVGRVYKSVSSLMQRKNWMLEALVTDFSDGSRTVSFFRLLVIVAFIISLPFLGDIFSSNLSDQYEIAKKWIKEWFVPFSELAVIIGSAIAWVTNKVKPVTSAIDKLENIRSDIAKFRGEAIKPTDEELKLRKDIEESTLKINDEKHYIAEAESRISEAECEMERINAGGLVYDFLNGRVRDSRYLDRLGLISVIRRDFEELGSLLQDWRKNDKSDNQKIRPIERIILYIDDLDRCPPKRVVEVLQAVHLLLAFDLFVVVVAVDARWLERALNEAYNPLSEMFEGNKHGERLHRFNAHNYLEKIFQIPFSLPSMEEKGYRKLISQLIDQPRKNSEMKDAGNSFFNQVRKDEPNGQVRGTEENDEKEIDKFVDEEEEKSVKLEGEHVGKQNFSHEKKYYDQKDRPAKQMDESQQKLIQETDAHIEAATLEEWEERFMAALFCYIETPRLAKRLVNIYRLIRVRAASVEKDFSFFVIKETGQYRAVLLLLAISVGRSGAAPEILNDLHLAGNGSFRDWLRQQSQTYESKREGLGGSGVNTERIVMYENLSKACIDTIEELDMVSKNLMETNAPSLDDDLANYAKWAREVGRYSFRWNLKS